MDLEIANQIQTASHFNQIINETIFRSQKIKNTKNQVTVWREPAQLAPGIAVAQILHEHKSALLVLATEQEAREIQADLNAMGIFTLFFPSWGMSLHRGIRSQNRTFVERANVLSQICHWKQSKQQIPLVVIASVHAVEASLPPVKYFSELLYQLYIGKQLDPPTLAELLISYGFYRVPRVSLVGEFSLRGGVIDFFPLTPCSFHSEEKDTEYKPNLESENLAVRIMFDFEQIESIKVFDPHTQISRESISHYHITPLKEVLWGNVQVQKLQNQLDTILLEAKPEDFHMEASEWNTFWSQQQEEVDHLIEESKVQQEVKGEELLFPLLWNNPASLQDYLGSSSPLILWGMQRIAKQEYTYQMQINSAQNEIRKAIRCQQNREQEAILPTILHQKILSSYHPTPKQNVQPTKEQHIVQVHEFEGEPWPLCFQASMQYHGNLQRFREDLDLMIAAGYHICIGTSSMAQAQRVLHLLKDFAEHLHFYPYELQYGAVFPTEKVAFLQEWEILGQHSSARQASRKGGGSSQTRRLESAREKRIAKHLDKSQIINSFIELKEGDLVVHVQHGIGRFKGIEHIKTSKIERDYLVLDYSDNNTLFIPIEQVNMIQRYIGNDSAATKLDRIGGKSWQERKHKTQKAVDDLAEKLLRLYSRRVEAKSYVYPEDDTLQEEFDADFPYEPTHDQLQAIREIKDDLCSEKPMDRLLCGDVGFGKTEVSMRACFKVAISGRQVILLCPTTILAEQHYKNFQKRFKRFPLKIAMLSRFVERKDQKKVLEALETGNVDILIGTHRILSKDIHLRDLGLIVIDEEQRFGVKHKERLKMLKTSVDSLSMSATPIPRTLHMSLVQIRDISMLTSPPKNRHPVETFVREFDPQSIAIAIRHELNRGGQVFYLHNRIEDLGEILLFLQDLVPEALVEMAHGKMDSKILEDIMYRFVHNGFNVLLSTSIIENGIDISNVNTIIIDRADRYGIGQLYQLRGRVGRSDQLAYAYLFYPDRRDLSEIAIKRLKIISDFTELGSGFKVAMKDLEVRGAGNLLGPEQSGNILAVGFEMYTSMLAKSMYEKRTAYAQEHGELNDPNHTHPIEYKEEISLELEYSGYIPDAYIPDATEKIDLYQRISKIDEASALSDFYEELFDRFGTPPTEVNSLLSLVDIRIICRKVGINYLKETKNCIEVQFSTLTSLPMDTIMRQIQNYPEIFRIHPKGNGTLFIYLEKFIEVNKKVKQKKKKNADYLQYKQQQADSKALAAHNNNETDDKLLQKTLHLGQALSLFQI